MTENPSSASAAGPPPKILFQLRPVPGQKEEKHIEKGSRFADGIASVGWFTNGAVQVEEGAIVVVDADADRHVYPIGPGFRIEQVRHMAGTFNALDVWLINAENHVVVELPYDGINLPGFRDLARAAGLPYAVKNYADGSTSDRPPAELPSTVDKFAPIKARNDRFLHRLVHPLQRGPRPPEQHHTPDQPGPS